MIIDQSIRGKTTLAYDSIKSPSENNTALFVKGQMLPCYWQKMHPLVKCALAKKKKVIQSQNIANNDATMPPNDEAW